ncbi:ESPR-type extended signal peptide-containing protein [Paraburkholderia bannensis]|uniref:ESPR-type extended signal peptide-containing protein n=1 Tax=Paraburkholderia bannensis TaxID=765414 RepID=UPI002AC36CC3|nr:ESPR-type extended signal peptide-containing protein [Paraburkholderia bannensis]
MNNTYRSVWSETDQTWVAAPETSSAGRKTARRLAVLAGSALGIAASLPSSTAWAAAGTVGQGGIELCTGVKGYAWGSSGSNEAVDCSSDGKGTSDGLAFALNNAADTKGGYGFGASTAQVAGYQNGTLKLKGASVMVYGPTTFDSVVTMSNQKIVQLAPGKVSADSTEAVNGSQLYALSSGVANAVQYDSAAHDAVTFGGAGAGTPVALHNVANGAISPTSSDAVNGAQLYGIDQSITNITNDNSRIHNTLTTAGWGAQATSSSPTGYTYGGYIVDTNGNVSNPSVLYVPNTIGTANAQVVLDPGKGDSTYFVNGERGEGFLPKGTVISNVANGVQGTDAANVGQVGDMIAQAGGGSGAKLLMATTSDANGASGVNSGGLTQSYKTASFYSQVAGLADNTGLTAPSDVARALGAGSVAIGSNAYTPAANSVALGVQAYASAKDAVAIGAGSVANQGNTVSVGNDGSGSYVAYDANGRPYMIQNAANTRRIVNLAAGQGDTDAVNVSQMRSVVSALGGGASINAAGGFVAPTYSVGGTTVNTVGDAITNLDNRILKNTADIASFSAELSTASSEASTSASSPVRMVAATRSLLGASPADSTAAVATSATTDTDALHYDSADHSSVTLSSTSGANVSLSGLQNGELSANSSDAVTGQQLYATNQQVASINQAVQNISLTGSTAVSANTTSGVAAASGTQALAVGGGAVATGANSTAIGDKANASASNAVAIGANSIANRDNAVSVGQEGAERQIVNVAAGTSGTDAVNLNQLNNAMTQQSNAFGQQISNLQGSINTVSKNAYAGVAAAMAMPNLTPSGPGRTVVAAGGGYYMGGSAAAVGVTYRSTNMHWLVNGAASVTSTGNAAVRTQVGYEF